MKAIDNFEYEILEEEKAMLEEECERLNNKLDTLKQRLESPEMVADLAEAIVAAYHAMPMSALNENAVYPDPRYIAIKALHAMVGKI